MNTMKAIFACLLFVGIVSCQQDIVTYDDNYDNQLSSSGPPQISRVTFAKNLEENISEASMTEMIVLHGDNLTGIKSIRFNDIEVDLKTVYAVRSKITLPVPRVVPNEVTNKVTVVTELGTANTSLVVNIPTLVVEGFYNEFVAAGDTAIVVGKYMDLYKLDEEQGQFTLAGTPIVPFRTVADSLYFVIPEGTAAGAGLSLSSELVSTPLVFKFREAGFSILDINSVSNVTDGSAAGDPTPLPGFNKFMRIHQSFSAWSWNGFFWTGYNLPDPDIFANPSHYYVKFEINTKSHASISSAYWILGGDRQELRWNPGANGAFNTFGKWRTVRLELTDLYKDAGQSNGTYLTTGWNAFVFSYQPMVEVNDDFSVTNFRIVKK